jgi:transposase
VAEERFEFPKEALPFLVVSLIVQERKIMSLIIGLDPHKASNTIAVLEPDETIRVTQRFENSDAGFAAMLKYVEGFRDRKWAVEGASGMGRSVAQRLVRAGETVVDVPAKLAAQIRVYATGHGRKTDTTDAISIAKAALRSKRPRPVLVDDDLVALKLLVDRRKELVSMRVQSMCRLHRLLRELISGGARQRLSTEEAEKILETVEFIGPAGLMRHEIAVDHLNDVLAIDARIDQINLRIQEAAKTIGTTLVDITGIALISAATIMAETGDITRFPTNNHFASYTGTAPIDVSSGNNERHRLSRAGNRQLNSVFHVAAIVQIRYSTPGRAYYERKLAEGKTKKEAIRCLKRRISDAVYQRLRADHATRAAATPENPPKWPSMKTRPASFRSKATPRTKPHPPRKTATTNNVADRVRGVASNKTGPTGASPARPRPTSPKRPKLPTSNPPS